MPPHWYVIYLECNLQNCLAGNAWRNCHFYQWKVDTYDSLHLAPSGVRPSDWLQAYPYKLPKSKLRSPLTKYHAGATSNPNINQNQDTLSVYSRTKQMQNRISERSYGRLTYLDSKPESRIRLNYWTLELSPRFWLNPEEKPRFFTCKSIALAPEQIRSVVLQILIEWLVNQPQNHKPFEIRILSGVWHWHLSTTRKRTKTSLTYFL